MSAMGKQHSKGTQLIDAATQGELWIFIDVPTVWANMKFPIVKNHIRTCYVCGTKIL